MSGLPTQCHDISRNRKTIFNVIMLICKIIFSVIFYFLFNNFNNSKNLCCRGKKKEIPGFRLSTNRTSPIKLQIKTPQTYDTTQKSHDKGEDPTCEILDRVNSGLCYQFVK